MPYSVARKDVRCPTNAWGRKGPGIDRQAKTFLSSNRITLFYIRTSNFGAEADLSYISLRFETENVLSRIFLNLHDTQGQLS